MASKVKDAVVWYQKKVRLACVYLLQTVLQHIFEWRWHIYLIFCIVVANSSLVSVGNGLRSVFLSEVQFFTLAHYRTKQNADKSNCHGLCQKTYMLIEVKQTSS